jgi:hypothetical protein
MTVASAWTVNPGEERCCSCAHLPAPLLVPGQGASPRIEWSRHWALGLKHQRGAGAPQGPARAPVTGPVLPSPSAPPIMVISRLGLSSG